VEGSWGENATNPVHTPWPTILQDYHFQGGFPGPCKAMARAAVEVASGSAAKLASLQKQKLHAHPRTGFPPSEAPSFM